MDSIRDKILEHCSDYDNHEAILKELIQYLDTDTLEEFKSDNFGNEGF